jgi:hypothetical protein
VHPMPAATSATAHSLGVSRNSGSCSFGILPHALGLAAADRRTSRARVAAKLAGRLRRSGSICRRLALWDSLFVVLEFFADLRGRLTLPRPRLPPSAGSPPPVGSGLVLA